MQEAKKYVSIPLPIEAIQVQYDDATREGNQYAVSMFAGARTPSTVGDAHPETLGIIFWDEQPGYGEVWDYLHSTWVSFKPGDWIMKGMKGEFYPCDNEVFRAKYREVTTDEENEEN